MSPALIAELIGLLPTIIKFLADSVGGIEKLIQIVKDNKNLTQEQQAALLATLYASMIAENERVQAE